LRQLPDLCATRSQHDIDHNGGGTGDECDPLTRRFVLFNKVLKLRLTWQSDPAYTSYNLYRGSLAVLLAVDPTASLPGSNPYAARFCGLT